jgi:hypothetical protein
MYAILGPGRPVKTSPVNNAGPGVTPPSTADLWVQASLNQKQRLQQLFFPEGVAFDGNRLACQRKLARDWREQSW